MASKKFAITDQQWERFLDIINSDLGELLTAGLLNGIADEVVLNGGNRKNDLECRLGKNWYTVEVKSAWWHNDSKFAVAHSPVRESQKPALVALVGKFDSASASRTVRDLADDSLTINDDRFFYIVPYGIVRENSRPDGSSTARSLISKTIVDEYEVDLSVGLSRTVLESLLGVAEKD